MNSLLYEYKLERKFEFSKSFKKRSFNMIFSLFDYSSHSFNFSDPISLVSSMEWLKVVLFEAGQAGPPFFFCRVRVLTVIQGSFL